jgi:hypothetical protein
VCEPVAVRDVGSTTSTRRCARATNASSRRRWHTCCDRRAAALDLIERAPMREIPGVIFDSGTTTLPSPPSRSRPRSGCRARRRGQLAATTTCCRST